jgi:hypothetical protein
VTPGTAAMAQPMEHVGCRSQPVSTPTAQWPAASHVFWQHLSETSTAAGCDDASTLPPTVAAHAHSNRTTECLAIINGIRLLRALLARG